VHTRRLFARFLVFAVTFTVLYVAAALLGLLGGWPGSTSAAAGVNVTSAATLTGSPVVGEKPTVSAGPTPGRREPGPASRSWSSALSA